jgi:hypothetical protein
VLDGILQYRREWRDAERQAGMTALQKTSEVLKEIMNGICGWLSLTMETEEMFGGVLPTLDLEMWVRDDNKVIFQYFEKSMVPKMVIHRRSAMPESTRRATLNQELIRRMVNTSEMVDMTKRLEIVDNYATKLINSEYTLEQTRDTLIGGLKGYERLLSLSRDTKNPRWKPLHMPARWNARNRRIAKMKAKNNWYKGRNEVEPPTGSSRMEDDQEEKVCQEAGKEKEKAKNKKKRGINKGTITLGGLKKVEKARKRRMKQRLNKKLGSMNIHQGRGKKRKGPPPPTRSVMFVDNTAGGELAKRLQAAEDELGEATGYRIRIAESAGSALGILLPSTNPWGASDCERADCVICKQGDRKRIDCKRRNVLYENRCEICNEDQQDGKKKKSTTSIASLKDGKGIYVGESSRSLHERAKEHEADKRKRSEDSHQVKHWLCDHPELLEPPKFKFSMIKSFQDPLSRQLSEAVRIELRGENILNSRSEFNRCRVPRLRINQEEWGLRRAVDKQTGATVGMASIQEEEKATQEAKEAEESLADGSPIKRKKGNPQNGRKEKRRKLDKLVGWGEGPSQQEDGQHSRTSSGSSHQEEYEHQPTYDSVVQCPKTLNARGACRGESSINMLTGLISNMIGNPHSSQDEVPVSVASEMMEPAPEVVIQSPKTINASGVSSGESSINMLTGRNGNNVEDPNIMKDGNRMDREKTKLFLKAGMKNKPKSKEKRRVRGKLSEEEEVEMKRTCKNVFDWLKPRSVIIQTGREVNNITHKPDTPLKSKSDLNNIKIMINDKTAHTPELGPSIVHTEQEEPVIDTDLGSDNLLAGFHTS